jgi:hypothetical protein
MVGAVLAAALAVLGTASPAQAVTCSYRHQEWTHPHGVVRVAFNYAMQCSDGRAHVNGTIYDILCDARRAVANFSVYDYHGRPPDYYYRLFYKPTYASNGCGTSSTFVFDGSSPGTSGWKIEAEMYSENWSGLGGSDKWTGIVTG